ncbi:hypothetical protein [Xenorhabdus szentirmaii]|uniref:Uncharacterized protein n=1 Tax=Xenorhabdus szentirmaii DSM 16338 TaxID=1427518 RepID=W1IZC1_9GAMM|nr:MULTISPECIES: hypothetical protein [Xenorhabdus]MBD2804281.1 hypothetical protein [Xenorhabdus sp. ZM]PHM31371.1 hypothetical protein Xsze_02065 [Xenorhabdus szentirmaii DSM 16338]PHM42245.1 hypothetical protein Xszus_01976 [Xenorhabdus szentirmaii]CDL82951.1 conserved hypothetical protein [Xenorhabdus szentirmaii DSM 16338]
MRNYFYFNLDLLSKELDVLYTKEHLDENNYYFKNKEIKTRIVHLIVEAKNSREIEFIDKALLFLFENTGCHEDLKVLNEINKPLFEAKILNDESLDKYLVEYSPLSRWL